MADAVPTSFDELIDRALRGERVDPDAFLSANPGLSEEEKKQVRGLCGGAPRASGRASDEAPPVEKIGPYRLRERIGAGAMGAVFLAHDETLDREVAVKILGPDILGTGERSDRFLREIRAAARLRHPNIVTVHAAGEQAGVRYMAMELIPGANLHDVIAQAAARGSRPPLSDVVRWGAEIARALEAAHASAILHRDVKPSNIRIASDGRAVLLDFGLAREATDSTITETGSFRGSPQYASPEQVEAGKVPIDGRTDVYSLAATLYEAVTGVAPCRGETREQLFHAILTRDPVPVRRLDPSVPRDLETVILASLQKDPALRHPTSGALADDLEAVRDGRPVSVRPPSPPGRAIRWARRHPARAALALALLGLVVAFPVIAMQREFIRANLAKIEKAEADEKARQFARLLADAFLEYGEGDPAIAQNMFEEAMRFEPASHEAKAGFALARVQQGDPAGARTFLDSIPEVAASGWAERIRAEIARRAATASRAVSRAPTPAAAASPLEDFVSGVLLLDEAHSSVGNVAAETGAATKAFEHFRRAVLASPSASIVYHYELGHAAWHAGKHVEAREIAAAIERLWPDSPERWFAIGRTLMNADREAGLDAFEKAARNPPRALHARSFIASRLGESGRGPEVRAQAIALARGLVAEFPDAARAHHTLGYVLMSDGQVKPAIAALSEAIRLRPGFGDAHRVLARAFTHDGQPERALASAREAARLTPDVAVSWGYLGHVLLNAGQLEEAIRSLERALQLNPDSPESLCNLGAALFRRGEPEKAIERLRKGDEIGARTPGWRSPARRLISEAERLLRAERALAAGYGEGPGAPSDAAQRHGLRMEARAGFEAELAMGEDEVTRDPTMRGPVAVRLGCWARAPALARTRSAEAAELLREDEVEAWRALWERCQGLTELRSGTIPVSR